MATYLHIDVDAFLASVEQSINPELAGRPVMVGGLPGERGIVYCPSYEARARGVKLGVSLFEAAKRIPDGIFLKGDAQTYEEYSQRFMTILRGYTPQVEKISADEACLEITGLEHNHQSPLALAISIREEVYDTLRLPTSIGIGPSRVVAKIASEMQKPRNLVYVPAGTEKEFLAPLPIEKIPGIGHVNKRIFNEMGIKTIGQLQTLPENYLITLFGQNGRKFAAYAVGQDGPLIRDFRAIRSVNRETGLATDITDREVLLAHYFYLLERACRRLREIQKKAGGLTVKLRYSDHQQIEGYIAISPPSWDEKICFEPARMIFTSLYKRRCGIRFVGVTLTHLKNTAQSQSFILDQAEKKERLMAGVDLVRRRFGFLAVGTGRTFELNDLYRRKVTGYELRTPGLSL
jgi:DNA polymerase-4